MSVVGKVRRAAEWVGDVAEKAKAVAGAVSAFAAVVVAATAKETLGLDDVTSIVTAGITAAGAIYYIIWRTPNDGFVNLAALPERRREAVESILEPPKAQATIPIDLGRNDDE